MSNLHPEVRSTLLGNIEHALYHKIRLQQTRELYRIILENSKLHGNTSLMLRFRGTVHSMATASSSWPQTSNPLHRSLRERMNTWLAEQEAIEEEQTLALGYVQRVLLETDRIEDLYRLLPDALAPVLRKFARHFRSGEGRFPEAEAHAFERENEKYILQLKVRMTRNLLATQQE